MCGGLIRQHQFDKGKLVSSLRPNIRFDDLEKLTAYAETV